MLPATCTSHQSWTAMCSTTPRCLATVALMGVSTVAMDTVARCYPKDAITSTTNSRMAWHCSTALGICTHQVPHMATTAPCRTARGTASTHTLTTIITWVLRSWCPCPWCFKLWYFTCTGTNSIQCGLIWCLCLPVRVEACTQLFPKQSLLIVWAVKTSATTTGEIA